ncbi:hypothetical protein M153_3967000891 [Pseudoloma neurophilia]|uniref:Checkpoint 9-1-1 complex, RAD1 component n=1 Tax=Pseudoloma neurophilia TaxID=146866 RepID=A0A0R0LT18_9MICR|nr:hypothetical protein M153_3967000891 [Pseudoloma neurophilia]
MLIFVKNTSFFKSILRVFDETEFVNFKIREKKLFLTSILLNIYFIEIDEQLLEFQEYEEYEFTVSSAQILKALKFFNNQLVISLGNHVLKLQSISQRTEFTAKIPLSNPFITDLNNIPSIDVIFTVQPTEIHLLKNFKLTHFFISEKVFITQNNQGGKDEGFLKVDLLESGIIDFKCDNKWFHNIYHLRKHIIEYIFVFSEMICQISINFQPSYGTNLIIQVPKMIE